MELAQNVLTRLYQHEARHIEKITTILAQFKSFKTKKDPFDKDIIQHQAQTLSNLDFWMQCASSTPELRLVGMALGGLVAASSSAERNWATYKWMKTKKQNRLALDTVYKMVYVHSFYKVKETRGWKVEIEKWSERDGFVMRNAAIDRSNAISVRTLLNHFEDWETVAVRTKNNDSLTKLLHKYQYVCIKGEFAGKVELRRIINIEWQVSQKRGESAGYVAVTQLIEEENEDDEDFITNYVISSTLHDCIRDCPSPYNDSINII